MTRLANLTKHPLVLVLCLILSSCGDRKATTETPSNDNHPVGTWKIDSGATLAANQSQISGQLEGIPEANQAEVRTKLEDMFKSLEGTMEFKADNSFATTTVFDGKEMAMQGTWEIDGDKITSRTKGADGEQILTGTIQEGRLKLSSGGDQFLVLRRE